jgi:hypothetical protein
MIGASSSDNDFGHPDARVALFYGERQMNGSDILFHDVNFSYDGAVTPVLVGLVKSHFQLQRTDSCESVSPPLRAA